MKTKEEQIKLLEETVAFYNLGNRCVEGGTGGCMYYIEGKSGCAIGRLISDKELCKLLDNENLTEVENVYHLLPPELQEYPVEFLTALQKLHDFPINWTETGLSPEGKVNVEKIKKSILL